MADSSALSVTAIAAVQAFAAIAVAWFALQQLLRERKRDQERRRAAHVELSWRGYVLRKQILELVGRADRSGDDFQRNIDNREYYANVLGTISANARQMMAALGNAPHPVASAVRRVFIYVNDAEQRLKAFTSAQEPPDGALFEWIDLRLAAERDLRAAAGELFNDVIEPALTNEEGILGRTHSEDSFQANVRKIAEMELQRLEQETDR